MTKQYISPDAIRNGIATSDCHTTFPQCLHSITNEIISIIPRLSRKHIAVFVGWFALIL